MLSSTGATLGVGSRSRHPEPPHLGCDGRNWRIFSGLTSRFEAIPTNRTHRSRATPSGDPPHHATPCETGWLQGREGVGMSDTTPAGTGRPAALQDARDLIERNAADWGPDIAKLAVALLGGGPMVALGVFAIEQLPKRRVDRVVEYLRFLHDEVGDQRAALKSLRLEFDQRPEASGLFEAGCIAAANAPTEARRERLAKVVASGLTADEVTAMNAGRRLRLVGDMDDGEFALLVVVERERRITLRYDDSFSWVEDGSITFRSTEGGEPPPALPGELADWSLADLSTALNHLAGLGLIEANTAQHSKERGAVRSYAATPAGEALVRVVFGPAKPETAP